VYHKPREGNGLLCIHRCVELVSKTPSDFLLKQKKSAMCQNRPVHISSRRLYLVITELTVFCCELAFRGNRMKQRDKHTYRDNDKVAGLTFGGSQCHHMSLMDFVFSPPGCGQSVTDF
jgi:hypothetical protein